jgi:[ribosomal protein S5]-alanine N-acetyltransferase
MAATGMSLAIERLSAQHETRFLDAAARSATLHRPWVSPPRSAEEFRLQFERGADDRTMRYVAVNESAELAAAISLGEIVRGSLQSAYLGFYVFVPFDGRGLMKQALRLVLAEAFETLALHRVEANVQPGNERSKGLVERLGFRLEGFSPKYLKIGGEWRDHERYAMTAEEWALTEERL